MDFLVDRGQLVKVRAVHPRQAALLALCGLTEDELPPCIDVYPLPAGERVRLLTAGQGTSE